MKDEKKISLFKEFLGNNQILIVDKSSASRRRLIKTLCDMGANRSQVGSVAHYTEALQIIKDENPQLILSDYMVSGGSGFDLFAENKSIYPMDKKCTSILITSNISQSAVAKAAEEDVDSFIIKPYTVQSLEKSLINAVIAKLHPSEYVLMIEKGKELLFSGKYEEASKVFNDALVLNKKPSLAHFYHGQCQYFLNLEDEAESDYSKGLEINNIHFKCQVGLYELYKKEGKLKEAYEVVRNIAKYFPANPERLKEVVRLAIKTENYDDMEEYYNIFVDLDERTEDVVTHICAGMYVYGKYKNSQGNDEKMKEIFERVGISCAGLTKFLNAMIETLVENNIFIDAKKLLNRFAVDDSNRHQFDVCQYLAESASLENKERITKGLELFNRNNKHPLAMRILINSLYKEGSEKKAEQYLDEAKHLWPESFEKYKRPKSTEKVA
jgi:CheY-like chemotaxis protein